MNDVVSARNACGSLCLRNRSFLHLFCGRAHMLALDRMLGAHSNVFQPAACFLSEPVQRGGDSAMAGGEVACRARLLGNPTLEGRAVSGPNLCPGGEAPSSRVVVHPIHSLLRFCSSPPRRRPSGDAADGKSRLLLMPLPPPPPPFHFDVYKLPGSKQPTGRAVFEYQRQLANGWQDGSEMLMIEA